MPITRIYRSWVISPPRVASQAWAHSPVSSATVAPEERSAPTAEPAASEASAMVAVVLGAPVGLEAETAVAVTVAGVDPAAVAAGPNRPGGRCR